MNRLIISGTHSSVGKTTITCGLMRALKDIGYDVSPYKVGADYIDTTYHSLSTGNISTNLDEFMLSKDKIREIFVKNAKDISIIEGVMGLFDGYQDNYNYCSTSSIAKILDTKVILIIDAGKMSSSIMPIVKGFTEFDKNVHIVGLILNNVSTKSHYDLLKSSIEKISDVHILGAIPKMNDISITSRHLGLKLADEDENTNNKIQRIADIIKEKIDLEKLIELSKSKKITYKEKIYEKKYNVTLAVAKDKAFNFYYNYSLLELEKRGVNIVYFNTFKDKKLPICDGVYIGGGYPEIYAKELSTNKSLMQDIKEKSEKNMPIYAECGGLMYLGKSIFVDDHNYSMVGIFDGYSKMSDRLQRFGYSIGISKYDTPITKVGDTLKGHEFHHSTFESDMQNSFDMQKELYDKSVKYWSGGYLKNNTLASYLHTHFSSNEKMVDIFCTNMENYKNR